MMRSEPPMGGRRFEPPMARRMVEPPHMMMYPDYVGCTVEEINGINITINHAHGSYTVYVCEGQLVSLGYIKDDNGKMTFCNTLGTVISIGKDAVRQDTRREYYTDPRHNPGVSESTYWLKIDASTKFESNIFVVYVRDIRYLLATDIPEQTTTVPLEGPELPDTDGDMLSFYKGKLFYVTADVYEKSTTSEDSTEEETESKIAYTKGLYLRLTDRWINLTTKEEVQSSPLVKVDGDSMMLDEGVEVAGEQVDNAKYDVETGVILNDEYVKDVEHSSIITTLTGKTLTVEIHALDVQLGSKAEAIESDDEEAGVTVSTEDNSTTKVSDFLIATLPEEYVVKTTMYYTCTLAYKDSFAKEVVETKMSDNNIIVRLRDITEGTEYDSVDIRFVLLLQ